MDVYRSFRVVDFPEKLIRRTFEVWTLSFVRSYLLNFWISELWRKKNLVFIALRGLSLRVGLEFLCQ